MRSVYSLSLLTLLSGLTISNACGAEPPLDLIQRHQCQFDVVLGRVIFRTGCPAKGQHRHAEQGVEQTLSVTSQLAGPSLHYVCRSESETLILDVFDGVRAKLERRMKSGDGDHALNIIYTQPEDGEVTLQIVQGTSEHLFTARSLWHLCVAEPRVFKTYLEPALLRLHIEPQAGWRMDPVETEIEQLVSDEVPELKYAEFKDLINQLAHPSRARRNDAQRRLQECGVSILSHIKRLNENLLDSEQRARLAQIEANLEPRGGDRPFRVASWLAGDRDYWMSAVRRMSLTERLAVNRRLQSIAGTGLPAHLLEVEIRIADGFSNVIQR